MDTNTNQDSLEIKASSLETLIELARNANGLTAHKIDFSAEDAKLFGLPSVIPFGFDHRGDGGGAFGVRHLAEPWRLRPEHRKGAAKVTTLQSFIALVRRHKTLDSAIFAETSWPKPALRAVIDYHKVDGTPDFGQHSVDYHFPVTDEFAAWAAKDGVAFSQAEFAAFIEEHVAELADAFGGDTEVESLFRTRFASPAEMVELSRGLQVNVSSIAKSSVTLASGVGEVIFTEEHHNTKGDKLTIPGLFLLSVPAFLDSEPVRIPTRLRYRVRDGKVTWFYQMWRWKNILRERVIADLLRAEAETALPAFEGAPEA